VDLANKVEKMSDRMWEAIGKCEYMYSNSHIFQAYRLDCEAKYDAEVELHKRKAIKFTVIRPGGLTQDPAKGAQVGKTHLKSTRYDIFSTVVDNC